MGNSDRTPVTESHTEDRWWERASGASLPTVIDAFSVGAFVLLADGVLIVWAADGSLLRALFGLPLLFFVPGYAAVAALFPGRSVGVTRDAMIAERGIDWQERLALSVGASVALLPVISVGLSVVGLDYSLDVVSATISIFAIVTLAVAVVRRHQLPEIQRFEIPYDRWIGRIHERAFVQPPGVDVALNVVLATVVVAAVVGVGVAAVVPNNAEAFTSATIATEGEDGSLVAGGYPDTLDAAGSEFVLQLENHEGTTTAYTVVGELQQVATGATTTVQERQEVLRTSRDVAAGETWASPHVVRPELAGEDLRLTYYVYRGDAPATPSEASAYRTVHIWVAASASADG